MSLKTIRRMAGRAFNAGIKRIKILDAKKASEALTTDDVRMLEKTGVIKVVHSTSVGRGKARARHLQKLLGRRRGPGRHKGTPNAVLNTKTRWLAQVRAQRKLLAHIKPTLAEGAYQRLYRMVKGGLFRNKKSLETYVNEHNFKVERK